MAKIGPRFDRSVLEIARGIGVTENPKKRNTGKTARQIAEHALHRSEHVEQKFLIDRLFDQRAKYPELQLLYAVPNGGLRSKATAGKMKAEGVTPNVPDLVLPVPRALFHGLYVEMKAEYRYGGAEQRKFQGMLLDQGYAVLECRGEEAGYISVMSYLALPRWGSDEFDHETRARTLRLLAGGHRNVTIPARVAVGVGERRIVGHRGV